MCTVALPPNLTNEYFDKFVCNNVCKICKHYVLDIPTSKIPAHIEKMALPTSKSVGNIGFNLHFHMIFFLNFSGSESKF